MPNSFVTPWTIALQAYLSMGILQEKILELIAIAFSTKCPQWEFEGEGKGWDQHITEISE